MTNELYQYVVVNYFATGEGVTKFLMITRAHPTYDLDYELLPSFGPNGYDPGKLKTTAEERAIREMIEFAGDYFGIGAKILSRDEFFKQYGNMIPEVVKNLTDPVQEEHGPANFHFKTQLHFNYS